MNNFKKFFCVAFVFLFILTQSNTGAAIASNPSNLTLSETKIYSTATAADDFVDNHVLVALTNEASLQFRDYSPEDFPEIDCLQTEDLTKSVAPMVQMKVDSMPVMSSVPAARFALSVATIQAGPASWVWTMSFAAWHKISKNR